ncbi:putative immunoglobulin-blocking virulence protein, partial [Mycoplasma flocculare]
AIIAGFSTFFANPQLGKFLSFDNLIGYNSQSPSIVAKNDANDPTFYSPVTNSEFKPFENKKPKVDLIKPEIKPEIKKEIEKPEIK